MTLHMNHLYRQYKQVAAFHNSLSNLKWTFKLLYEYVTYLYIDKARISMFSVSLLPTAIIRTLMIQLWLMCIIYNILSEIFLFLFEGILLGWYLWIHQIQFATSWVLLTIFKKRQCFGGTSTPKWQTDNKVQNIQTLSHILWRCSIFCTWHIRNRRTYSIYRFIVKLVWPIYRNAKYI